MEYLIIFILMLLLGAAVYAIKNLRKKIVVYEEWIVAFAKGTKLVQDIISSVDKSGAFKNDDEVGKAFQLINDTIKQLEVFGIIKYQGDTENEESEQVS